MENVTERPWILILPKDENDPNYNERNPKHSMVAIMMGDRVTSPGCYTVGNEIIFCEDVAPGENKVAEANAKYTLRAVNNHDSLLEACKRALETIQPKPEIDPANTLSTMALLIKVIAKAEEK